MNANKQTIVMVGHGSRQPEGVRQFENFVADYQLRRPDLDVRHGFIELAEPGIEGVLCDLANQSDRILIIPISLLTAGHVKNELPLLVTKLQAKYPRCSLHLTSALGVNPILISAVVDQNRDFVTDDTRSDTALVVVGRGSSDPDANGDFYKIARLLGEAFQIKKVLPCYIGITTPNVDDTLNLAARLRPKKILVIPYFLFSGVLLNRLAGKVKIFSESHPWTQIYMQERLASSSQVLDAVDDRVQTALLGKEDPLPCVTCQYRTPLGTITEKVGGLTALLWSVRHSLTHAETGPHTHAHKALKKHILVCTNTECADRGATRVLRKMRSLLREHNKDRSLMVTKTSCMGRCGEGPTVVVYPDGIWYRSVGESEAEDIVTEHILNGRIVGRCVDQIMVGDSSNGMS